MSRLEKEEKALVQIVLLPAGRGWQKVGSSILEKGVVLPEGKVSSHPQERLIERKISQPGFKCAIRLLTLAPTKEKSQALLYHLAGSFGGISLGEGNAFFLSKPSFWQEKKLIRTIF